MVTPTQGELNHRAIVYSLNELAKELSQLSPMARRLIEMACYLPPSPGRRIWPRPTLEMARLRLIEALQRGGG